MLFSLCFGYCFTCQVYFSSVKKVPEELQGLLYLNLIAGLIEACRDVLLGGIVPRLHLVLYPAVLDLVLYVVSVMVRKL